MAKKKAPPPSATFWSSDNFWQPTYRSWPWPPDRLEVLANRIGVSDDELRVLLVTEIGRRESPQSPQTSGNGSAKANEEVPGNLGAEPPPATSGHPPPPL